MIDKTNPAATGIADRANRALLFGRHITALPNATVLGIDLGLHGALARLTLAGELLGVFDAPTLRDGAKGRETINAPIMAQIIADCHSAQAFIEHVGPRPHEGPLGAFSFGRALGVTVGICAAYAIPASFITAPAWKRLVGIAPGAAGAKDAARSEAIRRWPDKVALFARVRDDGRAEACLIPHTVGTGHRCG
jgi:crossover junction endodeoxyribonuclease RuvC